MGLASQKVVFSETVLSLITNTCLDACSMGRSDGLALRISSTYSAERRARSSKSGP
jgi:hypothetical protein